MEKKNRKPLTAEQRAKKNAADRARRAAKKPVAAKPAFIGKPKQPKAKKPKHSKKPALPKGMRPLSERSGKFKRPVKIKQHGITRPTPTDGDGKPRKTFMVWDVADKISAKTKKPATRAAVKVECDKMKTPGGKRLISYSTFSNSFYAWRQFNGIKLRLRLDGKLSKPMGPGHGPSVKGKKTKPAKKVANKPQIKAKVTRKPALPVTKPAVKAASKKRKPAAPVATNVAVVASASAPVPEAAKPVAVPSASPDVGQAAEAAPVSVKPALPGKPPLPAPAITPPPFIAPPPL